MAGRREVCWRGVVRWGAAWLLLTAAGTLLHYTLWTGHPESSAMPALQSVGNAVNMLVGAGWIVLRLMRRDWPTDALAGPLAANAMGWAVLLLVVWASIRIGKRLVRSRVCAGPASLGPPDSGRRRFLVQGPAAVAALGGGGVLARSTFVDPWDLRVVRYRVPIRDLPHGLDGMRIAQLSDTHLGPRIPGAFIRRAVDLALGLRPDLVALTGDYIHYGARFIEASAGLMRPLAESGAPVVAVRGNHDWYCDGRAMGAALDAAGIVLIDNRRVWLDDSRRLQRDPPAGAALCIAGLGDLMTDWVDVPAALSSLPAEMPRLVLCHNPDTAEIVAGRAPVVPYGSLFKGVVASNDPEGPRIDLMLCGHTHGGQVRVPLLGTPLVPSRFGQRYAGGLVDGPGFPVVVNRGVGMSILPVRLGVPPEVVEITLSRA